MSVNMVEVVIDSIRVGLLSQQRVHTLAFEKHSRTEGDNAVDSRADEG